MRKFFLLLFLLMVAGVAQARHAAVPLKDPLPVSVPAGLTSADVEKVIMTAGASRSWHVVERKPGSLVLEYAPREFSVKVQVRYDAQSVSFTYAGSSNMEYQQESGGAVIHPNYNRWTNNLSHDIQAQLSVQLAK